MQENIEIWKDVVGYEGLYKVSNFGKILKLSSNQRCVSRSGNVFNSKMKQKILNGSPDKDGYLRVSLTKNGINKTVKIHRIVAIAFIDNLFYYDQINHKNENKKDNSVQNLEWCDAKYNSNYGNRNKNISKKSSNQKTMKKVAMIKNDKILIEFNSIAAASRYVCGAPSNISMCCKNKPHYNTAYGYEWKFI